MDIAVFTELPATSIIVNPFEGTIKNGAIQEWIEQFATDERSYIVNLLENFSFYSPERVNFCLKNLHHQILELLNRPASEIWFIPVGYVAKSGSVIAYFYKTQNDIPQDRFILATDLPNITLTERSAVVFLDDYIGSGHQGRQVWDTVLSLSPNAPVICPFVFAAIVGTRKGVDHLSANTGFKVSTVDVLDDTALPLDERSKIYAGVDERAEARVILEKYGAQLYPKAPLGYAGSQGLLGFFYSTPNNTLPIFWSTEAGWKPLLPHKESYRDPAFLVGPPSGLAREVSTFGPRRPLVESARLEEYEIEPEIALKLLTEFRRLDILLALTPIVRSLNLDDTTLTNLLRLLSELRHLKHERENVCTSILIIPENIPPDALGTQVIHAASGLALASTREIIALAQLIRGFDGGTVATVSGKVLGDVTFRKTSSTSYHLLPERYHRAARASLDARGLLFLFPGDGRAVVFYQGNRILTYRGASWHLQPADLEGGIRTMAAQYQIDYTALSHVFRLALHLSDEGSGALLTIGDHSSILALSDKPKAEHFKWTPMHVSTTAPEAVIGLMRQDGATIISADGTIIQGMTFLRPPAGARGVEEVGKGSKHSTAAKISSCTRCISIAVSVDGQITVFAFGDVLFKLMG